MTAFQRVVVLGSTGSIGESTLDVIARHPDRLAVYALSAYSRMQRLAEQALASRAAVVVVPDTEARARFMAAWPAGETPPEIRVGAQALADTAADPQCDSVMAAIVGAAGLPAALAAARKGKRVLLANKEALVAAGSLFMQAIRDNGAELLPIDSEHNAIFQCMPHGGRAGAPDAPAPGVRRLLLTASGGPFRGRDLEDLHEVTPAQACAHPNWSMGRKISVDSATMLNKGLEVIEAHWLFAMPPDRIEVVVHPQSVVHSMVEYDDGSVLAQLGQPDMRTPIAYGLGFPERLNSGVGPLDLTRLGRLDFEKPDLARFPCLALSFEALRAGQAACIALNAANEVAVEAFLGGRLAYTWIARVIEATLEWQGGQSSVTLNSLDDVLALDAAARVYAGNLGLA
ncbi:1-deoxy-D-xylulose-5-phosphate reductoisomerase [Achromobacter xylosoxidans]|uniref:1-deoxy-D-xylulose-5-phosphate reductoisomerase n=1 Tax=Alcaligenes xylosoxydans xylosoxydans TaxID=85698 RepID=UPI0003322165|nr:1-deoxy-D-xylulose-5-phosphate reductoisomerase [Achromobacter xylosoxidans]KWU21159.1 1-deoxy-D-xylulose 5-phosphate reductoisomerase [Achromobacter xylosoxidans]MCH1987885.1 1-deoxy-D-xylulose-5-phosphate reductoisomerase [Achromobacter xylosoxidans]MCH4583625.1 1-deoxy-D-xylulose-5-phosphate reductoisomerase [Achromobacter xylosoxidans]MCH4589331.1 1-deoxy-D-xylulose-5-phosphate reductoisomerase [Achromobacter xylosoxidans]MDH0523881.1 1-deoxy-D-xylulose-5-phosphate reductoisomerase [Ach